ncbi:MAG: hypothetical protein ISS65_10855 [Desulfobacterales bacterium]|nr:hypothetical protein [Desulfobacterales bacterium]
MNSTILAKSSSHPETPYNVDFIINDGILSIYCSCPAGMYGQLCKHKTAFIECDKNMLFDISQEKILIDVVSTIKASPLFNEYSKFLRKKKEIEKKQRKLKKELKDIKFRTPDPW